MLLKRLSLRAICAGLLVLPCVGWAAAPERPNFLIIVADDLGFSDIGAFGGEIATPNIDRLAHAGLRLAEFHTAATCSPTRAELLSGVDHHRAGIANMSELITDEQRGQPGYEGYLNERVVTIAELLRDSGYRTVMSGKWHLGVQPQQDPSQRGFEQVFALLQAGHNHFGRLNLPPPQLGGVNYTENGKPVQLPKDFYSSDYFTDKLLGYLRWGNGELRPGSSERPSSGELRPDVGKQQPFFAYLPFTAPHWPLQAPAELIEKYKGRYDGGWDVLRNERLARQRQLRLLPPNADLSAPSTQADWNALSAEQKQRAARAMEIYAAMVERMDWNIGRVLEQLRSSGQLDRTVVIFFSDNGAEGGNAGQLLRKLTGIDPQVTPLEQMGGADSLVSYGPNWAQTAMTPRRLYKAVSTEGGILSPAIIRYPGFNRQGAIDRSFISVRDIAPTVLELAGVQHPKNYRERPVEPLRGKSLVPYLKRDVATVHSPNESFGWELFGQRALRQGPWKITYVSPPNGSGRWELYNLAQDPGERRDVTAQNPKKQKDLVAQWNAYAKDMGIIPHEQVVSPYNEQ
jgi:arylsulfatase